MINGKKQIEFLNPKDYPYKIIKLGPKPPNNPNTGTKTVIYSRLLVKKSLSLIDV